MTRGIFILIATLYSIYPCLAQNNSTASARIINQSSNGLAYPSSSYIGTGTLSRTAQQGIGIAPQSNLALPKVNHGAYFGTPGDNLYTGAPDLSCPPQTVRIPRNNGVIYKQAPQINEKVYKPDPNIPMNYSDYKPELPAQIDNAARPGSNPASKNISN
jgi:hypothetical protein